VKPSQYIKQHFPAVLRRHRELWEAGGKNEFDPIAASAMIETLLNYLDEQHELDHRRRKIHDAMLLIVQKHPKPFDVINLLIESAGLKSRIDPDDADSFEAVEAEAKREGLL
jgi:hypothetical protein